MKLLNIDVTKIDKSAIFTGAKGKYIDLLMFENREGVDQYGNEGFVVQGISKERRDAGEKGPILGNFKDTDTRGEQSPAPSNQPAVTGVEDDIPF
jgi:hypothetical protein